MGDEATPYGGQLDRPTGHSITWKREGRRRQNMMRRGWKRDRDNGERVEEGETRREWRGGVETK